jgi:hypothetical protein
LRLALTADPEGRSGETALPLEVWTPEGEPQIFHGHHADADAMGVGRATESGTHGDLQPQATAPKRAQEGRQVGATSDGSTRARYSATMRFPSAE